MIDHEAAEPLISSPYKLDKQTLTTLVTRYKQRTKREEIDFLDRTCNENQISGLLNVNPTFGIDPSEIPERKRLYGSETPHKGGGIGTLGAILMNYYMRHLMFILIILCVFVGTIHVVRGSMIMNVVLSNSFFTAAVCFIYMISTTIIRYFSHHGEGKMLTETIESMKTTYVYRQKRLVKVQYSELVTGDIIDLKKGMFVPADIQVLESRNLTADESKYTKSHNPRQKANLAQCKAVNLSDLSPNEQVPSPILLAGSYILSGEGKGIVLLTDSESSGSNNPQPAYSYTGTNIQLKLEITGIAYMYMGIRAVLLFLLVLEIRYFVSELPENWAEESIEYLIYTISILTFITNEDLILILHDIIGTSIKSLLQIGILPRKFLAFDGVPFITDICIDKSQIDKEVEMVKHSLDVCATAGVKIRVVSEEAFEQTREAVIACGLITPDNEHALVIESKEFEKRIQEARETGTENTNRDLTEDVKVVVSSKPQDKEFLIYTLQENRSIVAFVGRISEDVVVMSKANVSFTLGSAPDLLKDSADFILIKEDFSNIVEIIKWGRNIYENSGKYFQFRAPTIISTLIITLIGGIVCRDPILKPVHLIWILILIELSARLLLASEKPNKEIMSHKPLHNPYGSIETRNMRKHIIGQAVYQILIVFVLLFTGEYWVPDEVTLTTRQPDGTIVTHNQPGLIAPGRPFSYDGNEREYSLLEDEFGASRHFTLIFNTYAIMVLLNIVSCRTLRDEINLFKGTTGDIKFIFILALVFGIHFFIGNFTGAVFAVSPMGMTVAQWFIALGFGLGSLVLSIILRLFSTKERDPLKEEAKLSEKND